MTAKIENTLRCELSLPNDARFLHAARAFVREVAQVAGFGADDVESLVHAADEACTNTLQHAFEPGESGTFTLSVEVTPDALLLGIRDQGLPFVSRLEQELPGDAATRGLGFLLIRRAVDEVRWINLGAAETLDLDCFHDSTVGPWSVGIKRGIGTPRFAAVFHGHSCRTPPVFVPSEPAI